MEQELEQQPEGKKYIRNYTEEAREKQKQHLNNIRQKAMEKKRELKEITLKAKLMKLEPKLELAKQYDEYINNKNQIQPPQEVEPIQYIEQHAKHVLERAERVEQPKKEKKKKIIYKEVEEEEEEEDIVYIKKNKPKPESLDKTLYKSSTEQLHLRAVEERIKHNLAGWYGALAPREY